MVWGRARRRRRGSVCCRMLVGRHAWTVVLRLGRRGSSRAAARASRLRTRLLLGGLLARFRKKEEGRIGMDRSWSNWGAASAWSLVCHQKEQVRLRARLLQRDGADDERHASVALHRLLQHLHRRARVEPQRGRDRLELLPQRHRLGRRDDALLLAIGARQLSPDLGAAILFV